MAGAGLLPASGTYVCLREPTGEDELVILETAGDARTTMLALASRLASGRSGEPIDWLGLPAVDLSAVSLLIRGSWLGPLIRTEALCPAGDCGETIDVAFEVGAYLSHHRPRAFRGARPADSGWFELTGSCGRFRIPTIGDLLAEVDLDGAALHERCLDHGDPPAAVARRIDRALDALAPRLDGEVSGACPSCGAAVELCFEPISYVAQELRDACAGLFAQVHELALAYRWSERAILALGRRRRTGYLAMIRGDLVVA